MEKKTNKKAYILNQKIDQEFNAAGKAMSDVFEVFLNQGVRIMPGVPKTALKYAKVLDLPVLLFFLWFVLKKEDYIIYSYPENKLKIKLIKKFAKSKIVCFINDINSIRDGHFDDSKVQAAIKEDMSYIGCADIIMAPNENSKAFLQQQGITSHIISVGTWDYIIHDDGFPISGRKHVRGEKWQIAFAGNLNKAAFIKDLDAVSGEHIFFKLWGNCDYLIDNSANHEYLGSVPPDELPHYVTGCNVGLVWDGESVHECKGGLGEYLRYNNSHKCGLYLACGLPVFVWKNAGLADFVEKNQCGFAIESLDEIDDILERLTDEEYEELQNHVKVVSQNVKQGYYLKKALLEVYKH